MVSKQTLIDKFLIPTNKRNIEVIRKRLLKSCSTNGSETLAATRAYDIMFKTQVKDLLLGTWEVITLTDLTDTESLENINVYMKYAEANVRPAFNEIAYFIPVETRNSLEELFSTQAPLLRVAVMVFIVALATMEELL